jgi:hypothetical protein
MKTKPHPTRPRKIFRGYRFTPETAHILDVTAARLRRTRTSLLEQLVAEYCTTKNLQP